MQILESQQDLCCVELGTIFKHLSIFVRQNASKGLPREVLEDKAHIMSVCECFIKTDDKWRELFLGLELRKNLFLVVNVLHVFLSVNIDLFDFLESPELALIDDQLD